MRVETQFYSNGEEHPVAGRIMWNDVIDIHMTRHDPWGASGFINSQKFCRKTNILLKLNHGMKSKIRAGCIKLKTD